MARSRSAGRVALCMLAGVTGCATLPTADSDSSVSSSRQLREAAEEFTEGGHQTSRDLPQASSFDTLLLRGVEPGVVVIRRGWVRGLEAGFQQADSRRCPAVNSVAEAFARLEPPRTRLLDVQGRQNPFYLEGPSNENLTGGPYYTLRSFARFENLSASGLEYTGRNASPVGEWFEASLVALEPCWETVDAPAT